MTENKRFTLTGYTSVSDHQKKRLYDLNDFDGVISVTETLNELHDENNELKKLLELISEAHSFTKEESVKEILRNEIKGIDTVTEYSASAWNDYCTLSNFFEKQYGEHWDNE